MSAGPAAAWSRAKAGLAESLGLATDALHAPLGLAAFLALAACLRRRRAAPALSLIAVAAAQLANEAADMRATGARDWAEAGRDSLATLLAPAGLALAWAWRRRRTGARPGNP